MDLYNYKLVNDTRYIYAYNISGHTWNQLYNVTNSIVKALTTRISANTEAFAAGGYFTNPGNHFAAWTSSWTSGSPGTGYAIEALHSGKNFGVYAGGSFTTPGNHIAKWIPTTNVWSTLGSGLGSLASQKVLAITSSYNTTENHVYAGGDFDTPASFIATWDESNPTSWSAVPGSDTALTAPVNALAIGKSLRLEWCCTPLASGSSCGCE